MSAEMFADPAGASRQVPEQRRRILPEAGDGPAAHQLGHLVASVSVHPPRRHTVSVVIPTLDEAENIEWTLARLPEGIDEVILVDGRSKDDTVAVACTARPDIRVVLESRPGKGAALRAGFAAARGDFIVMIDADGSMHPREIGLYLAYLEAGYEFVKGSRFTLSGGSDDMTFVRKAGHWPLLNFVKWTFRIRFTDLCYGFCAFRRSCLPTLGLTADGFEIESELVLRAVRGGLRIAEVPSWELPRQHGESHLHAVRDGWRILRVLVRERRAGGRPAGARGLRPHHDVSQIIDLVDRAPAIRSEWPDDQVELSLP